MSNTVISFIASRKEEASRRRHELDLYEAETRGMEMLLREFPNQDQDQDEDQETDDGEPEKRRSGRQPGSISKRWRQVLGELYFQKPERFDDSAVVYHAGTLGLVIRPRDARLRMDGYTENGLVQKLGPSEWRVTSDAVEKFGLDFRAGHGNGPDSGMSDPSMSLPLEEEVQEGR